MYETIIPELIKSRIKSGLPPLNLPKCYFTSLNDRVMILEDMRNTGFHRRNPPKSNKIKAIDNSAWVIDYSCLQTSSFL